MAPNDPRVDDSQFYLHLRKIVAKNPDFVYQRADEIDTSCVYFVDGSPSCLIGHVLSDLNFTSDEVGEHEAALRRLLSLGFSRRVAFAALIAQSLQDSGAPWKTALVAYEAVHFYYDSGIG